MDISFNTLYDLIQFYGSTMSKSTPSLQNIVSHVHNEELSLDLYLLEEDYEITSNDDVNDIFKNCTQEDANTQIIIGNNITIKDGVLLTPPFRCKGLIIYDYGTLTNNGIISMTARGAYHPGNDIYLCSINNQYQIIPKEGARGADRHEMSWGKSPSSWVGQTGYNGIGRQTGGGGNGGAARDGGDWSCGIIHEGGGDGTSYSGGAGSGGVDLNYPTTSTILKPEPGGAGTNAAAARWSSSWFNRNAGGGAGNPGGMGRWASRLGTTGEIINGESGTGGLIIIFANNIKGSGTYEANGSMGGSAHAGGGGSGGGSINIFATSHNLQESQFSVAGGVSRYSGSGTNNAIGGSGGSGTFSIDNIDFDLAIKFIKQVNSNIYRNVNSVVSNFSYLFGD